MNTELQDLLDPILDASFKGFPHDSPPLRRSEIAQRQWRVLHGDLPLPLALIRREALDHNLSWMQRFAKDNGVELAPHGKTTMSPQLFRRQLDEGAWGLTFATVKQAFAGAAAGAARLLIANQVFSHADLLGIVLLRRRHAGLRLVFLVDSLQQLDLIESWAAAHAGLEPFEVMLEVGVSGGRTGCRSHEQALALAARLQESPALRLVGIECYEGLGASGESGHDAQYADALMARVTALAVHCDAKGWFDTDEVLLSAGGSAIFDLVVTHLRPRLTLPVRGLLRSGCYVTHDHGFYRRMMKSVSSRLGSAEGLRAAIEVWALVQSRPEPGLAILAVGKRDLSYDLELPVPVQWCPQGQQAPSAAPPDWKIDGLNDQHAYLRWSDAQHESLRVGDRVALGISHPCTTFDKWRWMPVVDASYTVVDAIVTCF